MNFEDISFCTVLKLSSWTGGWYTFYIPSSSNLGHEAI